MLENTLAERTNDLSARLFAMGSEIGISIVHCLVLTRRICVSANKAAKFGCQQHDDGRVRSLILGQILVKSAGFTESGPPVSGKSSRRLASSGLRLIQSLPALPPVS